MSLINVDIHGFSHLRSEKGGANMWRTLVSPKKYYKNIDGVKSKDEVWNQKSGVFLTWSDYTPME